MLNQTIQYSGGLHHVRHICLFIAVALFWIGCSSWESGAEKDVVKNGISFKAFREYENGQKLGTLNKDTRINGWPCRRNFVVFYPDWRLDELHLFEDYVRNGISMPKGTRVFPNKEGNPGTCIFPHDVQIQGHLCRGGGIMTSFYKSGRLELFYTQDPIMIDGVPCKNGTGPGQYIQLHENGRLKQCMLDRSMTIGGKEYPKSAVLQLDEAGNVIPSAQVKAFS
jgi:hypothetical protein